jgi:methyl-accepting chemotaxis protein
MKRFLANASIKTKFWLIVALGLTGMAIAQVLVLHDMRSGLLADRRAKTQELVEVAYTLLAHYESRVRSGALTTAQAQDQAKAALHDLRYDRDEYFWINDMTPRMVMHPFKPDLDGKDLSNFADPNGKKLFVAFVDTVRRDGAGFVDYYWPKPGHDKPVPKISYVKGFAPWGWIVGSGIYVDDLADVQQVYLKEAGKGIVLFAVVGLGVGALVMVIVGGISRRARKLMNTMSEVAAHGDLRLRTELDGADEFGRMAKTFDAMLESFRPVVHELRAAADHLGTESGELAQMSTKTAADMEQQHRETEQVAQAMTEMSATVQDVARSTADAAGASQRAAGTAAHGREVVTQTTDTINRLANEIGTAADVIGKVDEESRQIGAILDVIHSIAEQTNLLALNAAIEAARAGDHGRGFAVVADEVRTLAGRTQVSTKEIRDMIERLQASAAQAVAVMTHSREKAAESVTQVSLTGEALSSIGDAVQRLNDANTQIASAAEEQSAVAAEINLNVLDVSRVSTDTKNSTRRMAEASRELVTLAGKLRAAVGHFEA